MHNFLLISVSDIPQKTKDLLPLFWCNLFSNDAIYDHEHKLTQEPSLMIVDGYLIDDDGAYALEENKDKILADPSYIVNSLVKWEVDRPMASSIIIEGSREISREEYSNMKKDVNSLWYKVEEVSG